MSASVTSSSRRRPLRATRSSSEANRGRRSPERLALLWLALTQSCEQLLQNHRPLVTCSSIDGSSQPHFGQAQRTWSASLSGERAIAADRSAESLALLAIARPTCSRNPPT